MIHRIFIPLLLLIILPDVWMWWRCLWHRRSSAAARCAVTFSIIIGIAMCVYTLWLAFLPDFAPDDMTLLTAYLLLLCIVFVPRFILTLCYIISGKHRKRRHVAMTFGLLLSIAIIYVVVYGGTVGFAQLTLTRLDYRSADIPKAFDGYKIVHFSDAHVGSYTGERGRRILARALDSINAQNPDLIVFTGDLQNMKATEIEPFRDMLSQLKAKDGVLSILGNHDYSEYIGGDAAECSANEEALVCAERNLGWDVLIDENRRIRRGADSIVVAGMENVSEKPYFAGKGDMECTMAGVRCAPFIIMLQHDPRAWRQRILPETDAQLTLSGHTHAGQMRLFGRSPVSLIYNEYYGMYTDASGRSLFVSAGIGGLVPFRYNVPGEIVVITLRSDRP